jgi:putative cell wall-binding protein
VAFATHEGVVFATHEGSNRKGTMTNPRRTALPPNVFRAALAVTVLSFAAVSTGVAAPAGALTTPSTWITVANSSTLAPGSTSHFNSFNQPSVNDAGLVAFRARTQGPSAPIRGVYTRDTTSAASPLVTVAAVGSTVPDPNNLAATFNEFPAFPRISATSSTVATRGQSSPVWEYTLPDTTTTKVGTSGVYANVNGVLKTAASLLGAVPGQEIYSVPGAPAGTRFDQFPGSPAVDGTTVSFKGNYTDGTVGKTGIYFRDANQAAAAIQVVASSDTVIPNQPTGGTTTFGSTAPPSAAGGRLVFLGLDNEAAPTMGGIYLAPTAPSPTLKTLVGIGDQVPGGASTDKFTGFGEALSFDGRYVAFSGSWGTETTSITLICPTDGNADLLAYCNQTYPSGYTTTVPVHQGIFVYDTATDQLNTVTTTGATFSGFTYWVYSGAPPGVGGGDAGSVEPPRWRSSSFVAVSGLNSGYQVAFKGTPVAGGSGIYLGQGPGPVEHIATVIDTTTDGTSVDSQAPAGSVVTTVGLERDGFRGRNLALSVSMLNSTTAESWAGVYLTSVQALTTSRIAGVDRFATSAAISAENFGPDVPVAYIANGYDFPDALSGAPVAVINKAPVLLVQPGSIPEVIKTELTRLNPGKIVILGGASAVSDAVSAALKAYTTGTVTRVSGVDRFATSAAISAENFAPGVPVAYIANGYNFSDALSGAPVAGIKGAPVLLVSPGSIPDVVKAELTRLNPGKIVILGGASAVSDAVSAALQAYTTGTVTRVSGVDRFATSAAISAADFAPGVPVAYIANGYNFPDALSGAPVAGIKGGPVLLVEPGSVPDVVKAELTRLHPGKIIILGGVSAVSDLVSQELFSY